MEAVKVELGQHKVKLAAQVEAERAQHQEQQLEWARRMEQQQQLHQEEKLQWAGWLEHQHIGDRMELASRLDTQKKAEAIQLQKYGHDWSGK